LEGGYVAQVVAQGNSTRGLLVQRYEKGLERYPEHLAWRAFVRHECIGP